MYTLWRRVYGYSLISMLISTTVGLILCACALHFLYLVTNAYVKIQQIFTIQHAQLITRHYIKQDLHANPISVAKCTPQLEYCSNRLPLDLIKPYADILIIQNAQGYVYYYLRQSAIPGKNSTHFTLYRDDIASDAVALVEDVKNLTITINRVDKYYYNVNVMVELTHVLKQTAQVKVSCTLRY